MIRVIDVEFNFMITGGMISKSLSMSTAAIVSVNSGAKVEFKMTYPPTSKSPRRHVVPLSAKRERTAEERILKTKLSLGA
jgi:hypothetical protein